MFPTDYEARLVHRFRDGDMRAMETLYDGYLDRAFRFASRLTETREDAEEVVQEAFLKTFRKYRQIQPDAERFGPWLFAVIRSTASDFRRQLRLPVLAIEAWECGTDSVSPEEIAIAHDQRRRLLRALESLPEDQQVVLTLCDLEDIDHRDAAAVIGRSLPATKSLLYRARRALRDACIAMEVTSC